MYLNNQKLTKKNILITCGGTREPIDPVRFIGNWSTGTLGFHLAKQAYACGARVTLICANCSFEHLPKAIKQIRVQTTQELQKTVFNSLPHHDILIMNAAVADFTPLKSCRNKIKKDKQVGLTLKLKKTPDILLAVQKWKKEKNPLLSHQALIETTPLIVGFAAETTSLEHYALKKLKSKKLHTIVANRVPESFGNTKTEYRIYTTRGKKYISKKISKQSFAKLFFKILCAYPYMKQSLK